MQRRGTGIASPALAARAPAVRDSARPRDAAPASSRWSGPHAAPRRSVQATSDAPARLAPQPAARCPGGPNFPQTLSEPLDQTCRASPSPGAVRVQRSLLRRDVRAQRRQRQGKGQEEGARLGQARARRGRLAASLASPVERDEKSRVSGRLQTSASV